MDSLKTIDLDAILAGLNQHPNVAALAPDQLQDLGLTAAEKSVINHFKPENALIIYGTLAPGKPNHFVVAPIRGEWKKGLVWGKLTSSGWGAELGYLAFTHCSPEEQQEIPAFILISNQLVANWPRLDEFEGEEYKRILAKYRLENGEIGIGYIYAAREEIL